MGRIALITDMFDQLYTSETIQFKMFELFKHHNCIVTLFFLKFKLKKRATSRDAKRLVAAISRWCGCPSRTAEPSPKEPSFRIQHNPDTVGAKSMDHC